MVAGPRPPTPVGAAASLGLAALLALAPSATAVDSVRIAHEPVRCLVAGKYPQLDACIEPPPRVARARVYFKGERGPEWYYVEMKPEAGCFRGTLPPPKRSLKRVHYYVAVTDQEFAESRTEEYAAEVVRDAKSCTIGAVAPYVTTASVLVSGAAALPAGFAGAGLLAGTTAAVAGAAVVGAGAATAVITGGPEPTTTTTTTTRPAAPTTTTTTGPGKPPTTTTTTLPGGCATDSSPPRVEIQSPEDNDDVSAQVDIVVDARDPGPIASGIREVTISAEEQGGRRTAAIATLPGPGPTFRATWMVPPCEGPGDRWYIDAKAVDGCDKSSTHRNMVRRRSSSCQGSASARAPVAVVGDPSVLVWTSELSVAGGRGQVVANGKDVVFPGTGRSELTVPARAGRNGVEALLVDGRAPGTWRFTLAAGAIVAGSLRVVAGEATLAGPETIVFRLHGRPGERAVFAFEAR